MASFLQVIWLEIRAPFNGEYIFWSVFLGYFLQIRFAVSSSTKSHYSFENSAKETNFRQGPFINYIKANLDGFHKLKIINIFMQDSGSFKLKMFCSQQKDKCSTLHISTYKGKWKVVRQT